ncbi:MAG: OBG GTPase family GTP-binding protein [Microgenomates group bacterium]
MDIYQQIAELEEKIRTTPYHKGTEHQIGRWRARIAQLKEKILESKIKKGGGGKGYAIKKSGDATVVLVGPPSVGKSSLLNKLTNSESKVGDYDFTTLSVVPGMMEYKGAKILILDIPGIIEGASLGRGRGKEVLSVARTADLILIVVEPKSIFQITQIKKELYEVGIRLNEEPPKVMIKKTLSGGIKISSPTLSFLNKETIKQLAEEFRIHNGEIVIKEDITLERLIDSFMGNRVYLPCIEVVNKIDLNPQINFSGLKISVKENLGIEELKETIWQKLELIRIFLKPKDGPPDLNEPLIVKKGTSLKEIVQKLGFEEVKSAKIFGSGAKFPGQEVSLDFTPLSETIVSFLK